MNKVNHVAIIMDGNGRWANGRSRPRYWGHVKGSAIIDDIIQAADDIGIKALTLYAFSTENWSRPTREINVIFKLLKKYVIKERKRIMNNQIRFKVIGDLSGLPDETRKLVADLAADSKENSGLKLSFAFGYGSRAEILKCVNNFIQSHPGKPMQEMDLEAGLMTSDIGDVDLLIRTGGDQRISNFLLWQSAYAELFFTPTPWPQFSPAELKDIIHSVQHRERRFGGIGQKLDLDLTASQAQKQKDLFVSQGEIID